MTIVEVMGGAVMLPSFGEVVLWILGGGIYALFCYNIVKEDK